MSEFLRRHVVNNPWVGHQLATGVTGGKLGSAFLLVNLVLGITYLSVFAFFVDSRGSPGAATGGSLLYFWHNTAIYFLLSILLPIKVSGSIEGPRFSRVFDQVVVTGVSPMRMHVGNWINGLGYAATLLFATLPFAGCIYVFGDVTLWRLCGGYATLLLYANVIIGVTLAASIFEREWLVVPLVIAGFSLAGILGIVIERFWVWIYPIHVAEVTPLRLFWRQTVPFRLSYAPADMYDHFVQGDPVFFWTAIPLAYYPFLLWGAVLLLALLPMVLGPSHRFLRGLNSFGTVVLTGDRRKRFFRKLRWALTRKVELAFLYENRYSWCRHWEAPLRSLALMAPVLFLWGVVLGRAYDGVPCLYAKQFFDDDSFLFWTFFLNALLLGLWTLGTTDTRSNSTTLEIVARWRLSRDFIRFVSFSILLLVLFLAHLYVFEIALVNSGSLVPSIAAATPFSPRTVDPLSAARVSVDWWSFIPGILAWLVNLFLISRLVSSIFGGPLLARFLTLLVAALLFFIPMGALMFALERGGYRLPPELLSVKWLSPFTLNSDIRMPDVDGPHRSLPAIERRAYYLGAHGILCAALLMLMGVSQFLGSRSSRKRSTHRVNASGVALLAIVTVSLLTGRTQAQESTPVASQPFPLVIQKIVRGFEGRVFSEVDFFTAVVENPGNETIEGHFWIDKTAWEGERQPFEIGPRTTKVFRWRSAPRETQWPGGFARNTPLLPAKFVLEVAGERFSSPERDLELVSVRRGGIRISRSSRSGGSSQTEGTALLVGKRREIPGQWIAVAMGGNARNFCETSVLVLPENPRQYDGIGHLFIDSKNLSLCSNKQRAALYEFIRLGGSVFLYGDLAASQVPAGIWQELLQTTASERIEFANCLFGVEKLLEGETVFALERDSEGSPIPLANVRAVGAGHLGHISFSVEGPSLPEHLKSSARFWREFDRALPRSRFPFLVARRFYGDSHLWDFSALVMVVGFFVLYTVVYSAILVFFFRRRIKRWKLAAFVYGMPLLFLGAVPLINQAMHSRPSYADFVDIEYFGPGSTHGIATAQAWVRSSGRQKHSLSVQGAMPRAYSLDQPYYLPSGAGLATLVGFSGESLSLTRSDSAGDRYALDVSVAPWAARTVSVVANAKSEAPYEGGAILDTRRGSLEIWLRIPPDWGNGQAHLVTLGIEKNAPVRVLAWPVGEGEGSVVRRKVALKSEVDIQERRVYEVLNPVIVNGSYSLTWHADTPRVLVAWAPNPRRPASLILSSKDIAFEREYPEETVKRWGRAGRWSSIEKRDGKYYARFHRRLVLIELPLEVR